ncbi:MAG: hypothetical protein V8S32_12540 [Lachnospiraceae bacterium]
MDKKEKGLVRHIGFSYHDNAELLDKVINRDEHPEFGVRAASDQLSGLGE